MNNWKKCKLGDICSKVTSGGTPLTSNALYYNGIIPWLNTKEVKNCRIYETEKYISQLGLENSSAKWIEANSVIVAMYGATAGKVAINKIPLTTNQACCNLTINHEKADYNFIYYLILNNFETLEILATGAAQQNLNLNTITSLEITLPPLEEQRQIATILSSIDDKIELLHEQNKTLEELAQTLFRHYFIENPNPSWQNVKLGDLVEETIGGEWGKENPIEDFKVPTYCFRGTDIADLITGLPKKIPLRYIKKAKLEKIEPKSGDILLEISGGTETQSTGRAIYIDDNIKKLFNYPIVFSNFCRLLRAKKIEYSYYLFFYLKYLYGNDEFFAFENGSSGIKNLDYKTLLNNTDCLKPDDEIFSFHKKVVLYFNKINKNKQQIQTLENMRDILIPKLLNGEIKINN
ncbi:TPA: restriction endonuclease subunit S [Campylobacter coli]|nr:restriction endonuclease subunit S [Campylobacter coli]